MKYSMFCVVIVLWAFITMPLSADSDCAIADLTKALPGDKGQVLKYLSGDWIQNAKICDLGFYSIAVPMDDKNDSLFIWTDNGPFIMFQRGYGFTLFSLRKSSNEKEILLTLQDLDDDYDFERLSYRVLDSEGQTHGDVTDFTMDGQPDLRIVPGEKEAQIWVNGKWYKLIGKDGRRGIEVNNQWKPVQLLKGRWVIKDMNN